MDGQLQELADYAIKYSVDSGVQYCDVRAEEQERKSALIENGETEHVRSINDVGIGIRLVKDGTWSFCSITNPKSKEFKIFESKLNQVMMSLAKQITIDGEGASKFIEIDVSGAKNKKDAKQIAFSIANSQLFKTAVAGEDPNWGRVLMAIGKSNINTSVNKINLKLGNQYIFKNGNILKSYRESLASKYMKGCEIKFSVGLGMGKSNFKAYTCDLTHKYISINADYRN